MAKRNDPFLPLYVNDFLSDEKLAECSAEATGVYIRLMCLMHKSEVYGTILLKQKYWQNSWQNDEFAKTFAKQLAKNLPYPPEVIYAGLTELLTEGVITAEGNSIVQKRMVKDAKISELRSKSGRMGAEARHGFAKGFAKAKVLANTENENRYNNESKIGGVGESERSDMIELWSDQVISLTDPVWESLLYREGLSIQSAAWFAEVVRDHQSLVSRYKWKLDTQQDFRLSLLKHLKEQIKKRDEGKDKRGKTDRLPPQVNDGKEAGKL